MTYHDIPACPGKDDDERALLLMMNAIQGLDTASGKMLACLSRTEKRDRWAVALVECKYALVDLMGDDLPSHMRRK
jgi:hypothetical protein